VEIADELRTGITQPVAAESGNRGGRIDLPDLSGQRAGVKITGWLAARDHHAHDMGALAGCRKRITLQRPVSLRLDA
jgi:hypothetical protein